MSSVALMELSDLKSGPTHDPAGHRDHPCAPAVAEAMQRQAYPSSTDAQGAWARLPLARRLGVLSRARGLLAQSSKALMDALPSALDRTRADSLASEVLPLLAACRFLEREAAAILRTRRLGRRGLPFWLAGVDAEVQRVPLGRVLVIAPGNYPLFLPGVQTLQALAAGNAVVWKPGSGGRPVALVFAAALRAAGVPPELLRITDESIAAASAEMDLNPDTIVFTGSSVTGRTVLARAAETATPVVAELSGCDCAIILPSADPALVVEALAFGMRLNGSSTCMAPRRLILVGVRPNKWQDALLASLRDRFAAMNATPLAPMVAGRLRHLLSSARQQGATILGEPEADATRPILIVDATPHMQIAQADLFAPTLTVLHAPGPAEVTALDQICPFGLTASIFGEEESARALATTLKVGTVTINDLIVPTADPRVPFAGRRGSGFGATRGAEGLLAMTAVKVISSRRGKNRRHLAPTNPTHEALFAAVIAMQHAPTLRQRIAGAVATSQAAMRVRSTP